MATIMAPAPSAPAAPPSSREGAARRTQVRKVLLVCGIVSSTLYFAADVLASLRYPGYSYTDQVISELSAVGAPTRPLLVPLYLAYSVLVIAFGVGVWSSADPTRALRGVGALLVGIGVLVYWSGARRARRAEIFHT